MTVPSAGEAPKRRRRWPLIMIGGSAGTAVWSGWVGIAKFTGFGPVELLPGIEWSQINTALTLPLSVEAYAVYALSVATDRDVDPVARRFAWGSSAAALLLGLAGQVSYHLLIAAQSKGAPPGVIVLVSSIPLLMVGAASVLWHLADRVAPAAQSTLREPPPLEIVPGGLSGWTVRRVPGTAVDGYPVPDPWGTPEEPVPEAVPDDHEEPVPDEQQDPVPEQDPDPGTAEREAQDEVPGETPGPPQQEPVPGTEQDHGNEEEDEETSGNDETDEQLKIDMKRIVKAVEDGEIEGGITVTKVRGVLRCRREYASKVWKEIKRMSEGQDQEAD